MSTTATDAALPFHRDRYTGYHYTMLAIFGFKQSVLGSVAPFLRDEQNLTITQIGWHFSIYALGLILSARLVKELGRFIGLGTILKGAAVAMVGAMCAITLATGMPMTLAVALLLGLTGGTVQIAIQSRLAKHHGPNQGIALVEAFVLAAVGVFVGPLAIGYASGTEWGWRAALFLPVVFLAVVFLVFRVSDDEVDVGPSGGGTAVERATTGRLPVYIVLALGTILLGIATEWGLGFWGAQFLETKLSMAPGEAVTTMSIFFGGTVIGRVAISRLLLVFRLLPMLVTMIVLGGVSVATLSFSNTEETAWIALFLGGACLGNFFPLILAVANEYAPERATDVSRGATLAVGLALLTVPYVVGRLGDWVGLETIVGLLAFLPLGMLALLALSRLARSRR